MLQTNFEKTLPLLERIKETKELPPAEAAIEAKVQRYLNTYERLPKTLRRILQNKCHASFPSDFFATAKRMGCFDKKVMIATSFKSDMKRQVSDDTEVDGVKWRVWKKEAMAQDFFETSRFKYAPADQQQALKILRAAQRAAGSNTAKLPVRDRGIIEPPSFSEYLGQLFNSDGQTRLESVRHAGQESEPDITEAEVDAAINRLGPKATGIDQLDYAKLKDKMYRTPLVKKLTFIFNKWWKGAEIPSYLKTARVVALSKDGT